jgi:hypothetical protein
MGRKPRLGSGTVRSTTAASWDETQLSLIKIRNDDIKAFLPTITSVTVSAACTT